MTTKKESVVLIRNPNSQIGQIRDKFPGMNSSNIDIDGYRVPNDQMGEMLGNFARRDCEIILNLRPTSDDGDLVKIEEIPITPVCDKCHRSL